MVKITQNKQILLEEDHITYDHQKRRDMLNTEQRQALVKPMALKPGLYLVSSPIGNLRDMTFRALDILSSADIIVCEDTRVTGKLLSAYGFKKTLKTYNDHSDDVSRDYFIKLMRDEGKSIALLSDAGTPLVSDPGYKLVQCSIDQDVYITTLPGANAVLPALQLSGLPSNNFSFLGFLPNKSVARQKALQEWDGVPGSLIIYESGQRLLDSLKDMRSVLKEREAAVMREITKMYEESRRGTLSELIDYYEDNGTPKGEIVIVLGAETQEELPQISIEEQLKSALKTMSVRDAAEMVSIATGKPKKTIYTLALKLATPS